MKPLSRQYTEKICCVHCDKIYNYTDNYRCENCMTKLVKQEKNKEFMGVLEKLKKEKIPTCPDCKVNPKLGKRKCIQKYMLDEEIDEIISKLEEKK